MKAMTPKQQQVYDFIVAFQNEHGYPPSVREIGAYVGLKSPSTVHFHLKGLEKAGLIEKAEGKTRAITVMDAGERNSAPSKRFRETASQNRIPVVGNVAAGAPILAEQCIEDYLTFDAGGAAEEYFALRVRGDSMIGAGILEGDAVIVRRQETADNHAIVVAMLEDEATVKRLLLKKGQVWLMPENPAYDPIDGSQASILGLVVAVYREYRA